MKLKFIKSIFYALISFLFILSMDIYSQTPPYLQKTNEVLQLMVNNKPFLMIAGELHNSNASSTEYIATLLPKVKSMNLNTIIVPISWEQLEPEKDRYDFTLLESLISNAGINDLKLCILWFASWKNGDSSYAPLWVKKDSERFFRVKTKEGNDTRIISPFCEAAMNSDAKAFAMMMKHIREFDRNKTVVAIQIENEVGIFQDIDYHPIALKKFEEEVPVQLISYLQKNKKNLNEELSSIWINNGLKSNGTWKEIFGDNALAKSYFMTWQYASYINEVATMGKKEYPLPMFVNAWIIQKPNDLPGVYPNGGPVSKVMDIYKSAAKNIDILSPDIYLPNFKEIAAMYHRNDNPLLIPESTLDAGRAFFAFAQHDAICYSPFGIEDGIHDIEFINAYEVLNEMMSLIVQYQGTNKMVGILKEGNESECTAKLGAYDIRIQYVKKDEPCYGIIIQTGENEFMVAGINLNVFFSSNIKGKKGYIGQIWEGKYKDKQWIPNRLLNGDESSNNRMLKVLGRQIVTSQVDESLMTASTTQPFFYSANKNKIIKSPGIYKVITYLQD